MLKTGKYRIDRILAWTMVLVVHALLGWMLLSLPAPSRIPDAADSALDIVWIAAPRAAPPRPQAPAPMARRALPREARAAKSDSHPAQTLVVDEPAPPAPSSMSAVFLRQATAMAAQESPGSFRADPLAHRAARLPGREANRFRMQGSRSPAERLALIGKLFGGVDDPCRSARDSINELSQEGDSRVLQDVLDYEQRFCR